MARSLKMLSNQYRSNSTKLGPFCDLPVFFGIEWRSGVPITVWCTGTDQYLSPRADELERSGSINVTVVLIVQVFLRARDSELSLSIAVPMSSTS